MNKLLFIFAILALIGVLSLMATSGEIQIGDNVKITTCWRGFNSTYIGTVSYIGMTTNIENILESGIQLINATEQGYSTPPTAIWIPNRIICNTTIENQSR